MHTIVTYFEIKQNKTKKKSPEKKVTGPIGPMLQATRCAPTDGDTTCHRRAHEFQRDFSLWDWQDCVSRVPLLGVEYFSPRKTNQKALLQTDQYT